MPLAAGAWDRALSRSAEAEVYHSSAWLGFLAATQGVEPIVATVLRGDRPAGLFAGGIVRRGGLRILGSPARGWSTPFQGFALEPGLDRVAALEALWRFALDDLGCVHVELADRWLTTEDARAAGWQTESGLSFVAELGGTEDEVFARLRRTTRQEIRKAIRAGVTVEPATDLLFADEYYNFLRLVYAHDGLAPAYTVTRVRELMRNLGPTGHLLALRVKAPDGDTIATSLSVGFGQTAAAWGVAFDRRDTRFHPMELLWWENLRHWHARGAVRFDLVGQGEYKAKYGGEATRTCHAHRSKHRILAIGRAAIPRIVYARQRRAGRRARVIFGMDPPGGDAGRRDDDRG